MINRSMARTKELIKRSTARRERYPAPLTVGLATLFFFGSALAISQIDSLFLLFGWLMAGPLAIAVYLTLDAKGHLLNPYTLFFGTMVAAGLGGFAVAGSLS